MHMIRWKQSFDRYQVAFAQLNSVMDLATSRSLSDLEKSGALHVFEYTHELAWNVLKDYLEYEGIQGLVGSRSTIRESFKRGLVADGEVWMDMIEKRNLTSHTYNQDVADNVVDAVRAKYHPAFLALVARLESEV